MLPRLASSAPAHTAPAITVQPVGSGTTVIPTGQLNPETSDAFTVPPAVVGLFVVSGAGTVLAPMPFREIAGNALLPLSVLYFLAGLSIICHFARKWFRARILRVGLYGLALYFPINVGVGLLGLFDWYADFRRRGEKA